MLAPQPKPRTHLFLLVLVVQCRAAVGGSIVGCAFDTQVRFLRWRGCKCKAHEDKPVDKLLAYGFRLSSA